VFLRHKDNICRLVHRQELKIGERRSEGHGRGHSGVERGEL
jgi:hypothetical protein